MDASPHTVIIGAADPVVRAYMRRAVNDRPELRLCGEAETTVTTLYLASSKQPSLVLMADESPGLRGRDLAEEIVQESGGALVVLLTDSDSAAASASAVPGVAWALPDDDFDRFGSALDDLVRRLESPTTTEALERRGGARDRRVKQDWSKVFAERRKGDRREDA